MMSVRGEKINVLIPEGMLAKINDLLQRDQSWISIQEFIRQAVAEKIERIEKEHALG